MTRRIALYAFSAWLALCWAARAEKVTVRGPRPVADAILKLEKRYGWPITYEDPPWVYKGDVKDVTSRVRKDGKRAGEGVPRIVHPRGGTITFVMEDAELTWAVEDPERRWPGKRSFEAVTRAAILAMLKSYSRSTGGVEIFALSESDGLFHVVPVQRRDASGKMERIVPILDTPVSLPAKQRSGMGLLSDICKFLTEQTGQRVIIALPSLQGPTYVSPKPGETARSVLSRLLAERASKTLQVSWKLNYQPGLGYDLNIHLVDTSR